MVKAECQRHVMKTWVSRDVLNGAYRLDIDLVITIASMEAPLVPVRQLIGSSIFENAGLLALVDYRRSW